MLGRYANDAVTDTPTRSQMAGAASEGSAMVGHSRAFHSPAGMSVFGQSVALTHFRLGWRYFFVFALHALLVSAIYHTGPATRVLVRRSVAIAFVAASHELQFGIRIG